MSVSSTKREHDSPDDPGAARRGEGSRIQFRLPQDGRRMGVTACRQPGCM
jgi:hypothetical protein